MLNPNLSLKVKCLIQLLAFLTQKQSAHRGRGRRRGGCPMGSSLPRHGARVRTKTQEKEPKRNKKKNQGQTVSWHQKNIEITIYMMHEQINVMMHALMQ